MTASGVQVHRIFQKFTSVAAVLYLMWYDFIFPDHFHYG